MSHPPKTAGTKRVFSPRQSSAIPKWQLEREQIIHRICRNINARIANGQTLRRSLRIFVWKWNEKPFKSDPQRKLRLRKVTLYRLWRSWKAGGEVPSSVRLKYRFGAHRTISASVLIRFVKFCAANNWRSLTAAHSAFCKRQGSLGPRRASLNYDALRWNLPRGFFPALRNQQVRISQAEMEIRNLIASSIAEIEARVPNLK